ncbi:MAG: biotin--[acetyl-CoA-carboxylase] ligase [Verrucomicrobiota bacterium]
MNAIPNEGKNPSDPDTYILGSLLAKEEKSFLSGNQLAQELNISRVGVWNRLEKLREAGFDFEAVRNRGYRLIGEPRANHASLLNAYLLKIGSSVPVEFSEHLDSTNSEAERQLANGRPTPFAVVANQQSRGRGRMGRKWESDSHRNIYLSVAFRPNLSLDRMRLFSLWVGVRICKFLHERGLDSKLKWPNDILVNGRKLAGMLTEARVDTDIMRDLIFGIGLNVNSGSQDVPRELRTTATSIAQEIGEVESINLLTAELIELITVAYRESRGNSIAEELQELWPRYDGLAGLHVDGRSGNLQVSGIASGITADGALIVESESGERHLLLSGDATLRK